MTRPLIQVLRLQRIPILQQLQLEEALLRSTKGNWLLVNDGSSQRAIVMGISGKPEELIDVDAAAADGIDVIKRFTGGGTVVVDHNTVFSTLIVQSEQLPHVEPYPKPIMRWTEEFYTPVFAPYGSFSLQEHDYAFQDRKFGGNAQAITGKRWLHHTSFLWDFDSASMRLLQKPAKQPVYRQGRDHGEFIVRLKDYMPSRQQLVTSMIDAASAHFTMQETSMQQASLAMQNEYLRGNRLVDVRTASN